MTTATSYKQKRLLEMAREAFRFYAKAHFLPCEHRPYYDGWSVEVTNGGAKLVVAVLCNQGHNERQELRIAL